MRFRATLHLDGVPQLVFDAHRGSSWIEIHDSGNSDHREIVSIFARDIPAHVLQAAADAFNRVIRAAQPANDAIPQAAE